MIPDELQDQAAIYVLGDLSAEETAAFEETLHGNAELQTMVHQLREAAGDLGRTVAYQQPPAELRQRVLREIALEKQGHVSTASLNWLPWAIAAMLLLFCGYLIGDRFHLLRQLADNRQANPLSATNLVVLASPNNEHPNAKAMVAWQSDRQTGMITINMPSPGEGRDYQLWAVDANHKDPVSAGVLHIEPNHEMRIQFKPIENVTEVKAFAISVEREGGVTKPEGPIVMIGNT